MDCNDLAGLHCAHEGDGPGRATSERTRARPAATRVTAAAIEFEDHVTIASRLNPKAGKALNRLTNSMRHSILSEFARQNDETRSAIGHLEAWQRRNVPPGDLRGAEFQVFSQWNEDGIIQHLLSHVPLAEHTFIEFGADTYEESNTRFLVTNDNWSGLILDADSAFEDFIKRRGLMWRYELSTRRVLLTADNLNDSIGEAGFTGDVALLSIDVDGNDYWLWEALEVVSPRIVICEYNSTFGPDLAVSVPYDPAFVYSDAHPSRLFFGASLRALCHVAEKKGYRFVGCESHGANAFFVRADLDSSLPTVSVEAGYVRSKFRLSERQGVRTYIGEHRDRLREMASCVLEDVTTGERGTVGELFGLNTTQ